MGFTFCGSRTLATRNGRRCYKEFGLFFRQSSQRANAVDAARIIRQLGIAEILPTVCQCIRFHSSPVRRGKVGAGLHHNENVRGPEIRKPNALV
jgi:hypothetical protein